MFTKNSRYYGLETVSVTTEQGETIRAVKLRRLPVTTGQPTLVKGGDQLDVISERRYKDGTRFWHVADANTELEANTLVETDGRAIQIPER
jgi:hypothetical protein